MELNCSCICCLPIFIITYVFFSGSLVCSNAWYIKESPWIFGLIFILHGLIMLYFVIEYYKNYHQVNNSILNNNSNYGSIISISIQTNDTNNPQLNQVQRAVQSVDIPPSYQQLDIQPPTYEIINSQLPSYEDVIKQGNKSKQFITVR